MGLTLSRAQETDKPFLFELRKLTMFDHLANAGIRMSNQQHMQRVSDFFDDCYLIKSDGKNAGMIKYIDVDSNVEIIQFQIMPKYQGKGIGGRIMKQIKDYASSLNKPVTLKVLKGNPAFNLYIKNGFQTVGEDELEYHMEWDHLMGIQISTSDSSFIGPRNFGP